MKSYFRLGICVKRRTAVRGGIYNMFSNRKRKVLNLLFKSPIESATSRERLKTNKITRIYEKLFSLGNLCETSDGRTGGNF